MLILTRNVGETIRIGDDIEVSVVDVRGGAVRLSITAPADVRIYREEIYRRIAEAAAVAAQVSGDVAAALAAFTPRGSAADPTPAPDLQSPEPGGRALAGAPAALPPLPPPHPAAAGPAQQRPAPLRAVPRPPVPRLPVQP